MIALPRLNTKTRQKIDCEIDKYYLDGNHYNSKNKDKRFKIEPKDICIQYEKLKSIAIRKQLQKKAQSKLVLLNNENSQSNWFCIDVEYTKSFNNKAEKRKQILMHDLILSHFPK